MASLPLRMIDMKNVMMHKRLPCGWATVMELWTLSLAWPEVGKLAALTLPASSQFGLPVASRALLSFGVTTRLRSGTGGWSLSPGTISN